METDTKPIFSEDEWNKLVDKLKLAPQQAKLMRHLFDGLSDKQIAEKMQIAFPTVRTHLGRLFTKYHVNDRSELLLLAFKYFREISQVRPSLKGI
jgi:DNA-binding NarL/FixJ family response regulator